MIDSRPDTEAHIARVRDLLGQAEAILRVRGEIHDASKLREPEKPAFDRLAALKLSGMAYGSEEYRACLRAEKPAIEHHYANNSHHPEFYGLMGVDGMSLFDVIEMLVDWKAASERMAGGGDIWKSIELNTARFKLSDQTRVLLENTAREMGWPKQ